MMHRMMDYEFFNNQNVITRNIQVNSYTVNVKENQSFFATIHPPGGIMIYIDSIRQAVENRLYELGSKRLCGELDPQRRWSNDPYDMGEAYRSIDEKAGVIKIPALPFASIVNGQVNISAMFIFANNSLGLRLKQIYTDHPDWIKPVLRATLKGPDDKGIYHMTRFITLDLISNPLYQNQLYTALLYKKKGGRPPHGNRRVIDNKEVQR